MGFDYQQIKGPSPEDERGMSHRASEAARQLISGIDRILSAVEVMESCRNVARANPRFTRRVIGRTGRGCAIEVYDIGTGETHALLYAFPDPGEAVGGTGVVSLMQGISRGDNDYLNSFDVCWHLVPCLNLDDQPGDGRTVPPVSRDTTIREVDWCLNNPRPETSALLDYARAIRPTFTFPLHDEYHSGESLPAYIVVCQVLDSTCCETIRVCLRSFGMSISKEYQHPTMGAGFLDITEIGPEYLNSTFSRLAEYGLVLAVEVSRQKGIAASDLVGAQLAAGFIALEAAMSGGTARSP